MSMAQLNGVTISYRRAGEGSDVVLIHGLAANLAFWHLDILLPLTRKHRLTVFDLRGHGYSTMPPSGYTPVDMAEDLRNLMDHLSIERAHLVGHSVGGVVALAAAAFHPQRVASLVVADSRIRALQPAQRWSQSQSRDTVKERLEELGLSLPEDSADAGIVLLERLASPAGQAAREKLAGSSQFVPFGRRWGGNRSAARWLELLNSTTARHEFTAEAGLTAARIAAICQPTLAIYGEHSPNVPSMCGLQQHLPNCQTFLVPEADHFFPLSRPQVFVGQIVGFLQHCQRRTETAKLESTRP